MVQGVRVQGGSEVRVHLVVVLQLVAARAHLIEGLGLMFRISGFRPRVQC